MDSQITLEVNENPCIFGAITDLFATPDEGLTLKQATDRQLFDEFLLRLKTSAEVEYRVLKQEDNGNVLYDTGDFAELHVSFDDNGNLYCFQVTEGMNT